MKSYNNDEIRELIENYLTYWKWYVFSLLICLSLAFINLRYSTEQYGIKASISVNNNNSNADENVIEGYTQSNQFVNNNEPGYIKDEIELLKSRSLLKELVQNLNLNIQLYSQGKFKESEIYRNPPIEISFLSNDTIISTVDTTLTVHIYSKLKYLLKEDGRKISFGDKISTSFGDIVITPNVEKINNLINKDFKIKITSHEKKISYYSTAIAIKSLGEESNIINISLNDAIPEKGIAIINQLIESYNGQKVKNKNEIIEETSDFINNRLQIVSNELSLVDLTAETVKKKNRLTDLGSQSSIYLQSERQIESEINRTTTQLQMIDFLDNYLEENSGNGDLIPANVSFEDNSINEITRNHNELVLQRNRILKNSSEINPVIINLDEQISGLKANLNASLSNIKSSSTFRLNALNREGSKMSSRIYSAPTKERQFRDLNRQQNIKESLYLYLLQKREEAAIANGIASPDAIIVNKAHATSHPISPKKKLIALSALMFGLIIPTVLIYAIDFMDNKINSKNDITNLTDIPYLGDIPKSKNKKTIIK